MKKYLVPFLFLALCAITILGCAAQTPAPTTAKPAASPTAPVVKPSTPTAVTPQYGGTLKMIYRNAIDKLGAPYEGGQFYAFYTIPAMERLVRHDRDLRPTPELAESWNIAPDGKTMTFNLRKGVKFHDGTLFNAEAVKFNFEQVQKSGATTAFKNLSSIDVVDEYTIRFNFTKYDSNFLTVISEQAYGMMASPTALKKVSTPETTAADHTVGTGPFKFASWTRNTFVKYEKFNDYWQKGKPYLDAIQIDQIADITTGIMGLRAGEAQVLYFVGPPDAAKLEPLGFEIVHNNVISPISILVPDGANADSPFANKSVRQAVEYAIDKKALAQNFGLGYYFAATQIANPKDASYDSALTPRNYDAAKAKQLLSSAGFPNGFQTKIIVQASSNDTAVAVASFLKEIGINATIDLADASRYTSLKTTGWKNGLMVGTNILHMSGLDAAFGRGLQTYHDVLRPAGWLDNLDAATAQPDPAKSVAQLKELNKMIYDETMIVPLYGLENFPVQTKNVHDLNWGSGHQWYYSPANGWLSK